MGKRKIYWWIQQINEIAGTEMASISIMNHLADDFDIVLLVSTRLNDRISYAINPKIKIENLNLNPETIRFDYFVKENWKKKRFFKCTKIICSTFATILFKRFAIRRRIARLLKEDDILIASSLDSYIFAPKKCHLIHHYHFSSDVFKSAGNRFLRMFSNKPNQYVFLLDSFLHDIATRYPRLGKKSIAINNPCRYEPTIGKSSGKNNIIFIGRLMEQKNPMLALKIAKRLNGQINFHLSIYGEGPLKAKLDQYIKEQKLDKLVSIYSPTPNIKEKILRSDVLLMTSKYEGLPLVIRECFALSCPCVVPNLKNVTQDTVITNKNGIVVGNYQPDAYVDALKTILKIDKLATFKKEAYMSAKKYNNPSIYQKWKDLLVRS